MSVGIYARYIFFIPSLFNFVKCQVCNNSSIPIWSWGLARRCCDVFPNNIGNYLSRRYEGGNLDDSHYFIKSKITNGNVVYVASTDFPKFIETFLALPQTTKIVLVTGLEDIGVPWELFHLTRNEFRGMWKPPITMRQFIHDPRLVVWFTQNYDLVGCNAFSCSDVSSDNEKSLIAKVLPIPIGVDFHSGAGKGDMSRRAAIDAVCNQRKELDGILATLPVFPSRPLSAVAAFQCDGFNRNTHEKTRGEVCAVLSTGRAANISRTDQSTRDHFWRSLGSNAFALAPAGHGIDTHRLWEVLNFHSVPIVLTSPLDRLYSQLPVVVLSNWSELLEHNCLARFKSDIQARFGEDPFASDSVLAKLTSRYWVHRIRTAASSTKSDQ